MKTDFNSLKKELGRLTDINYLKKEINRITAEVKKFDVQSRLSPQARQRVELLEERFSDLLETLQHLQKQVDASLDRFVELVRQKTSGGTKTSARKATRKTSKKTAAKTTPKVAKKKTSKKSARASK